MDKPEQLRDGKYYVMPFGPDHSVGPFAYRCSFDHEHRQVIMQRQGMPVQISLSLFLSLKPQPIEE